MKGGLVAQFAVAMALKRAGVRLRGDLAVRVGRGRGVRRRRRHARGPAARRPGRRLRDRRGHELRGDPRDARRLASSTSSARRATRWATSRSEEVVSPAVPMGRVLGWVDGWVARRKRVERSARPTRDFPDPAPVQVLAVEANRFDPRRAVERPAAWRGSGRTSSSCPARTSRRCCARSRRSLHEFARGRRLLPASPGALRARARPAAPRARAAGRPSLDARACSARRRASSARRRRLAASQWPCDAFIHQRFGMPTLLFGPKGAGSHNANEYVEVPLGAAHGRDLPGRRARVVRLRPA